MITISEQSGNTNGQIGWSLHVKMHPLKYEVQLLICELALQMVKKYAFAEANNMFVVKR